MGLRPIGTQFWYEFPPDMTSNNPHKTRIKYKVVEHVRTMRCLGDRVGELCERWEPLEVEPLYRFML